MSSFLNIRIAFIVGLISGILMYPVEYYVIKHLSKKHSEVAIKTTNWKQIKGTDYEVDVNSLKRKGDIVEGWNRVPNKDKSVVVEYEAYDCSVPSYQTLYLVKYDKNNNVVGEVQDKMSEKEERLSNPYLWEYIPPTSVGRDIAMFICTTSLGDTK